MAELVEVGPRMSGARWVMAWDNRAPLVASSLPLRKGQRTVPIPNPHGSSMIHGSFLSEILRQAAISREEWNSWKARSGRPSGRIGASWSKRRAA